MREGVRISPFIGASLPPTSLQKVDLPLPFDPSSAIRSSGAMVRLRRSSTIRSP